MRRVVLGQRADLEYGLWVSKPGKDAFTGGVEDFLLNATEQSYQVLMRGSFTIPGAGPFVNMLVASHNLGYPPTAFCTNPGIGNIRVHTDATSVYLDVPNNYGGLLSNYVIYR